MKLAFTCFQSLRCRYAELGMTLDIVEMSEMENYKLKRKLNYSYLIYYVILLTLNSCSLTPANTL